MFELVKYGAAIAVGYALGKATGLRPPSALFTAVVVLLVFNVAAGASDVFISNAGVFLAVSLIYAAALVFATAAVGSLFDRGRWRGEAGGGSKISAYVLVALAAGLAAGAVAKFEYSALVEPLLLLLLVLAGADISRARFTLDRYAVLSPVVAVAAAILVAPLFYIAFGINPAVAFGMGWYSFTGPYLARVAGPEAGVYGLLVNFLREQLTYVAAPLLAKRFSKIGVLAVGGATTMDNTLPVYTALYGSTFAIYAFTNGVVLTLATPVIVPAVYSLSSV